MHIPLITLSRHNSFVSYSVAFVQWFSLHLIRSYSATPPPLKGSAKGRNINWGVTAAHCLCSPAGRCGLIGLITVFESCLSSRISNEIVYPTSQTPRKSMSIAHSVNCIHNRHTLAFPYTLKNSASPAVNSSIQLSPSGLLCCLHPCSTRRTARARTSVSHSVGLHGFLPSDPALAQGCITCLSIRTGKSHRFQFLFCF